MADPTTVGTPSPTPAAPQAAGGKDPFANLVNSKLKKITGSRKDKFADLVNSKLAKMQQPATLAADNLAKIEDNPVDPKTGKGEGTYAINVNGKVKQVPFSKVPHVAAVSPMMTIGATTFANEADERRYIKDLYAADEKAKHEAYSAKGRWDMEASSPEQSEKAPDPIHEPAWWRRTKKAANVMTDIVFGGGGVATIPGMRAAVEGTELDPMVIAQKQAAQGDATAQQFLGGIRQDQKIFDVALVQPSESKAFQSVFDPKSKNWGSRFITHTVKAIENQTSIENLYTLASMEILPHPVGRVVGAEYQGQLITSGVSGVVEATKSSVKGEENSADKWGDLFGNALVVVGMHYGHQGIEEFKQRDTTATLNAKSQEMYGKKFGSLTDHEKVDVLYASIEDADPKFKKRIDQEIAKQTPKVKPTYSKESVDKAIQQGEGQVFVRTTDEIRQQRIDAAKKLVREIVVRKAREEAYRMHMAQQEHEARQAIDAEAKAVEAAAEASRIQGEKDRAADAAEAAIPKIRVVDRRAAAGETVPPSTAKVTEAESRVNEIMEQTTGRSFASETASGQRNAATWLEEKYPKEWEAFKATPAYTQYADRMRDADLADAAIKPYLARYLARNPEGTGDPPQPGSDVHEGAAKLLLARLDLDAFFKAKPETYRSLNEHAEKTSGKSFDSLDQGGKVAALTSYLKADEKNLVPFITDDVARRMATGQHIDIANMDAAAMMQQRAEVRMSARDAIKRIMYADRDAQLLAEEQRRQKSEFETIINSEATGESLTPSLQAIKNASDGLVQQAAELGIREAQNVNDAMLVEKDAEKIPPSLRTPKINEFLTRMKRVRAAVQDHAAQELADQTAARYRDNLAEGIQYAAKQVVTFKSDAADFQAQADDLWSQGQTATADAAQEAADANNQKAEAIIAGAQSETAEPVVRPPARPMPKVVLGAPTEVITPYNEAGHPAHYALISVGVALPSHHPLTFEPTPGYDQSAQKRDYSSDAFAQADITLKGQHPDGRLIFSNSNQLMDGPPLLAWTLDADGNPNVLSVLGGNGRTLIEERARLLHPEGYQKLMNMRSSRLAGFGLSEEAGRAELGEHFTLVRILDEPITDPVKWARMGDETNRDSMKGVSREEEGVAMANLLTPEHIERLDAIISSLPSVETDKTGREKPLSVREAMRMRSADFGKVLVDAGVIAPNKISEYLVNGELTEKAKSLFESMLSGFTVTNSEVLRNASASTLDKLTRAGISFVRAKNAGSEWDLSSMNTEAVQLLTKAQSMAFSMDKLAGRKEAVAKGAGGDSLIEKFLYPQNYVDRKGFGEQGDLGLDVISFDGQSAEKPHHPGVVALAMALEQSPREYALRIAKYADGSVPRLFGVEHPANVFNSEIADGFRDGEGRPLKVLPEEWGTVTGLPESVKAAIEEGRGPLPVEPSVHAETVVNDVHPDSSSVTDVIPEGPKTVQELRKALENHPNIDAEQAAALTDVFESILPRAIGSSLEELLGNRRLSFAVGGKDGTARGYTDMLEDGRSMIRLCDTADTSTFIHEMAHHIRRYLNPGDQAVANKFVGAKPGVEWTTEQEEQFAQAFERYHHDGGMRKGALKEVFKTLARAMQSIYNAVKSKKLAKGTPELNAMFDKWYDWETTEKKTVNRINVDESGKLVVPPKARIIERGKSKPSPDAQVFVEIDAKSAGKFVKKNGITAYEMHQVPGGDGTVYVVADAPAGKRLYQLGLDQTLELAKKAREYEAQFKRENDPRRKAWLRAQLNDIDDKLRGSTGLIGGNPEPKDTSVIQLVHGLSERPSIKEPTTPAQAVTEQQIHGDPTAISLGGKDVRPGSVSDETSGDGKPAGTDGVHAGTKPPEPRHAATGGKRRTGAIAKPKSNPFSEVEAAHLEAPKRPRGTPVVDPDVWRGHVEALGLPMGTPPPTIRIDPDVREILIFPGQAEAVEGALSALQQYDGTVLASAAGTGKNYMLAAMANHLLGENGNAVGLWVTRSQNLIHDAGNMKDVSRMFGIDVEDLPSDMADIQTGLYAATYHQITGNRHLLSVPWDFVLYDECDAAAKWTQSDRGKAVINLGRVAKKVVYSSATPYATTLEMGYMERLGMWKPGGFAKFGKEFNLVQVGPNEYSGGYNPAKLEKLRQQLIERGQWQQIHKSMEGTSAHVALIPQSEDVRAGVKNIRKAFALARAGFQREKMPRLVMSAAGHEAIYLKRYLESSKLPHAIELGKKAISDGWKPVFFTEYRSPADEGMDFINELGDEGRKINAMLPPLPDIVKELRAAFGDKIGIFAGAANQLRGEELEAFQSGEKDALYATYAAGGIGASAHDLVGDMPRMGLFISLPWASRMLEQATNRTDRYGRQSEVANVFLTTDALPEVRLLGTKVLPRMAALKAAVFGVVNETSLARNLREATGLRQELVAYDQGQEYVPQTGDFEQTSDEAKFTLLSDFDMPRAKDAKNKPMKYKGQGKRLYQGPVEVSTSTLADPEFKEWFSGSKVVDDDGQPLKVFHGTDQVFDEFDTSKTGASSSKEMDNIKGVSWFAEHPEAGTYFAGWREGGNVRPSYLSLKNPHVVDVASIPEVRGEFFNLPGGRKVYDIRYVKGKEIQAARDNGNDGVIFKNGYDGTPVSGTVYAAFSSDQIKPAFGRKRLYQMENEGGSYLKSALHKAREEYSAMKPETVRAYEEALENYRLSTKAGMRGYLSEQMGQMKKPGDLMDVAELERMFKADDKRKRLYQMEKGGGDEDPFHQAANDAFADLRDRIGKMPAPLARAVNANEGIVKMAAAEAGKRAMGSGESVKAAADRTLADFITDTELRHAALIKASDVKENSRELAKFIRETAWMTMMSGDRVVERIFERAGLKADGVEMKRRIIDFDLTKGLYQGRMQGVIREVIDGNNLKPAEIETMSRVVEGKVQSDDPRIVKAAKEFSEFTADVHQGLADIGAVVVFYKDGKRQERPYSTFAKDPNYWPRLYDWSKKFVIKDKETGKEEVMTLAKIMDMPTSDERRAKIIDQFAEEKGISNVEAQAFFERNDRGIRLAGNVERAREWNIPTYGRDREAIERYIDQVATTMAATEVHGQFRQKTDPIIAKLPADQAAMVNRIVTSDLDPAHLPKADKAALSATSALIITGKMFYSPIKVGTHLFKASLATNTRSLIAGVFDGVAHPRELFQRARDCNALLDYSKAAWMREYGMNRGNIGQKFLDFNGFTFQIQASRILSSAAGRHFFERYAYPELKKMYQLNAEARAGMSEGSKVSVTSPKSEALRRKLIDLYGFSGEDLDRIAKDGYTADDVRRMELGAANWVTGSNRPSEMPPMFRADKNADAFQHHLTTVVRMTQMLHGFMFKTANLVKRTVFDELAKSDWKSAEPYHLIARFAFNAGMAGFALEQMMHIRHNLQGSAEAEIEKHRHEWLMAHPISAQALSWSLANISMAVGVQPLSDLFSEMATADPKDRQKLSTQHRFAKDVAGMPMGIPGESVDAILTAFEDYQNTFADTGKHKKDPQERRKDILTRLLNQEVVGSTLIVKPEKAPEHHGRTRKPKKMY